MPSKSHSTIVEAEKMRSCQIWSKCDKSLSHKDLISHQKSPGLLLGLLSKPDGINNHHWQVGLEQFVTNVIQQVGRDEYSPFAFFFNSYHSLILNPLRRPDKLFLLLQSTFWVGPLNHTFCLSCFLSLFFVLNSVMTPPKHMSNWHPCNISSLSSLLLEASAQKAPAQGPPLLWSKQTVHTFFLL